MIVLNGGEYDNGWDYDCDAYSLKFILYYSKPIIWAKGWRKV